MPTDPRTQRIADYFASLTPALLRDLPQFYTEDAFFQDPFNEVRGISAITHIFDHMYVSLHAPRFEIIDTLTQGDACFITWHFKFHFKSYQVTQEQTVRGCSHLRFAPDGRVNHHRDYWDAAQELYEKLPVIGSLMRWLKRRVNA